MNECLSFSCWMKGAFHIVWRYQLKKLKSIFFYWWTIYYNGYEMTRLCAWCGSFHFCISAKKNRMEKNKMVDDVCNFVIIKINLTELDRNIVSLLFSWNKIAHFKERGLHIDASLYFIPTDFIVILLWVCVFMCISLSLSCVCVCVCVYVSVHKRSYLSTAKDFSCLKWRQEHTLLYTSTEH